MTTKQVSKELLLRRTLLYLGRAVKTTMLKKNKKHFTCWRVASFQQRSLLRSGLWELLHHFFLFFSTFRREAKKPKNSIANAYSVVFMLKHRWRPDGLQEVCGHRNAHLMFFFFLPFTDAENWVKVKQDTATLCLTSYVLSLSFIKSYILFWNLLSASSGKPYNGNELYILLCLINKDWLY